MNTYLSTINSTNNADQPSITHLQIANLTGVRADNVKRSIDSLVARKVISQPQSEYGVRSSNGIRPKIYKISERDSYIVVAQLYPEFTAKLVDYWMNTCKKTYQMPTTFREALLLAAELEERKELLEKQARLNAPKIDTYERVMSLESTMTIRDTAKNIGFYKQQDFFRCLQNDGYLLRYRNSWKASQKSIKAGLLEHKVTPFGLQAVVTMKGLEVFSKRYDFN